MSKPLSFSDMNDDQLLKAYDHALKEYERLVNDEFELAEALDPEVLLVLTERDDIHQIVSQLYKKGVRVDITKLRHLDSLWQIWALKNTEQGYAVATNRAHIPKTKWWWWIDKLSTLSNDERKSL